jgi:hypothetical protein
VSCLFTARKEPYHELRQYNPSMNTATKLGVTLLEGDSPTPEHERIVHVQLAERIARLLGCRYMSSEEAREVAPGRLYYLPPRTLVDPTRYAPIGIHSLDDLFGGLVSEPFMATKAISHPVPSAARRPKGWCPQFADQAAAALLEGFTVFSAADAWRVAPSWLQRAPLRVKPVRATAGRGQRVVTCMEELDPLLAAMDPAELAVWGLVLEQNLTCVETYSVGQVAVAGMTISYHGTQQLTHDHTGEEVYAGSQLTVARGGYAELLALDMDEAQRTAVQLAQRYEQAAIQSFPGFMASRRNYDIACGLDHEERRRVGVLEQSWRVGGASSAEILALQAFAEDPRLRSVQASTHEVFDDSPLPKDAILFYQGNDRDVGQIRKYARIRDHEYTK